MKAEAPNDHVDALVRAHWDSEPMRRATDLVRAEFRERGFCIVPQLVPDALRRQAAAEIERSLEQAGRRRDLRIKATGDSPRIYRSVDRDDVFTHASIIPALYRSAAFAHALRALTGEAELIPAPYQPEEIVINCMERPGDEHGWHWDDYRYSLVWVHKAPRRGNGGEVQFVRDTRWDKRDPQIAHYLRTRTIETHYIEEGAAYLLRGDLLMHRVSPLIETDRRIIICFTYAGRDELERAVSHETMEELYPRATPVTASS
jgi:hypothetical protein